MNDSAAKTDSTTAGETDSACTSTAGGGMVMGIPFGLLIGILFDDVAMGLALGLIFGSCFAVAQAPCDESQTEEG